MPLKQITKSWLENIKSFEYIYYDEDAKHYWQIYVYNVNILDDSDEYEYEASETEESETEESETEESELNTQY
jgi:hypothetical protein